MTDQASNNKGLLYRLLAEGSHLNAKERKIVYLTIALLSTVLIWGSIGTFLWKTPAQFVSEWTLILPSATKGHTISVESIGQASSSGTSPYGTSLIDPRVNYKQLTLSTPVLKAAAKEVNLSLGEFGQPRIKLIDQTSFILFKMSATTGELAQAKSKALYRALQIQLDSLRDQETESRELASLSSLTEYSQKLETSQQNKLNYQTEAGILSVEHFDLLVNQLEDKKAEFDSLRARLAYVKAKIDILLTGTKLDEHDVKHAIHLRNDPNFQEKLQRHADIHAQIASIEGVWGKQHPQLKQLHAAHHTVNHSLTKRGRRLIEQTDTDVAELIKLGGKTLESSVLTELLQLMADKEGLENQIAIEQSTITALQERIDGNIDDLLNIEDLARQQQVATAVFTSALTKQDIGKNDRFSSYPLIQLLAEPSLPESPEKLKRMIAIAGGLFCHLSLLAGLALLWFRKPFLQRTLKNA